MIAGMSYSEARRVKPGEIMDMFIYRRRYDDEENGIKRKKAVRCAD